MATKIESLTKKDHEDANSYAILAEFMLTKIEHSKQKNVIMIAKQFLLGHNWVLLGARTLPGVIGYFESW